MLAALLSVPGVFARDLWQSVPALLITAAGATLVGVVARRRAWWRKPDLVTDLGYLVLMPGLMHYLRIALLMGCFALLHPGADPTPLLTKGQGPLNALPFAAQCAIYLLGADAMLYACHRLLHGRTLWPVHAVHHSSEQLEWISGHRVHPLDLLLHGVSGDCILLLAGISPAVLVFLVPFNLGMGALVHADLPWDWGPLRYVLASPVFHRWHHTDVARGGERNFATNFPVFDLVFGTYYMPRGVLPEGFGVTERDVPNDLGGQLLHPFRRSRPNHAQAAPPIPT